MLTRKCHTERSQLKLRPVHADRGNMDVSTIALQGIQQADTQRQSATSKIASFGASSPAAANLDTVDLSPSVVALLSAKNMYSANVSTAKVADEILKTTEPPGGGRHSVKSLALQGTISLHPRSQIQGEILMKFVFWAVLACFLLSPAMRSQAKPPAGTEELRQQIKRIKQQFPGDMAVYMKNLQSGDEIAIDADSTYETFSVIKIPIMAEVFHQAGAGKLSLDERITLKSGDQRLPSGILYSMQPGLNPSIRDLLTLMIIISDNVATDLLADKVTRASVTRYMNDLGLKNTSIEYSDLDWDRKWLTSLDSSYKNAPGDKTLQFPFDKYSEAQVQHAFGETIYNAGIYFGHSTARELGRLFEMIQQKNWFPLRQVSGCWRLSKSSKSTIAFQNICAT